MIKPSLLFGILFLILTSCSNSKSNFSKDNKKDTLLIAVEHGPCFGACPEYKLTFYKSGFSVLVGKRNIDNIGIFESRLSKEQLAELLKSIRVGKIEEKDTIYINKYLADYPAWTLWVSDNNPTKKIFVNHESPPAELLEISKTLENLMNQLVWFKKSDINE